MFRMGVCLFGLARFYCNHKFFLVLGLLAYWSFVIFPILSGRFLIFLITISSIPTCVRQCVAIINARVEVNIGTTSERNDEKAEKPKL